MGDYYKSVVNLDKREKVSIRSLGEYHKSDYRFENCQNSLLPTMVTWLTVFRNQCGREDRTSQGSWVGDRVMFCGDGLGMEGDEPGWRIEEIYNESGSFKDITAQSLVDICNLHPSVVEVVAARCVAILKSDPQIDPRLTGDFRALVIDAIACEYGFRLERELERLMGDDLELFLEGRLRP